MAQATAVQALGRASQLLDGPDYLATARKALRAFSASPSAGGVKVRGFRGGRHYLQYSFAPRLFIMNAFLQSVIGLYDYAKITGDSRAEGLWRGRRARGRARGARLRHRRLVALQLPRAASPTRSTTSCCGSSWPRCAAACGPPSTAPPRAGSAITRPTPPCSTSPGPPPPPRTARPASASSSTSGRPCRWWSTRTGRWAWTGRPPSAAARARSSGPASPAGTYTIRLSAKELRTGKGLRSRTEGSAVVGTGIGWGVLWRLAPSSTRARAASARRASPRPRPAAARRPA